VLTQELHTSACRGISCKQGGVKECEPHWS
jgi:hypothetical protein